MNLTDLPTLNAILNSIGTIFLLIGYISIKKGNKEKHKKYMIAAVVTSALFLISYLTYHYMVGSVPYPYYDWTRTVYFVILIPHIILAALMAPFILYGLGMALKGNFEKHKKLMRFVWPVWIFVSVSGVVVYLMLYIL